MFGVYSKTNKATLFDPIGSNWTSHWELGLVFEYLLASRAFGPGLNIVCCFWYLRSGFHKNGADSRHATGKTRSNLSGRRRQYDKFLYCSFFPTLD